MKKNLCFLLIVSFVFGCSFCGRAQIITTVAGSGAWGGYSFCCDGGPATLAPLTQPDAIAVDHAGNLYFEDGEYQVRKVDVTGIITTYAGVGSFIYSGDGGPATAAGLSVNGIALDNADNLYICDSHNNRVRKVDAATGIISTFAGNGIPGHSGDGGPATAAEFHAGFIAIDSANNVYLDDSVVIRKVDAATGIITTVVGSGLAGFSGDGGPATAATDSGIDAITIDNRGNLYLFDHSNYRVRVVNAAGIINTFAGNGTPGFSGDGGPATAAEINLVDGLLADDAGNVYISDAVPNERIRKVNAAGIITTIAGNGTWGFAGDGGPATAAVLWGPDGIARYGSGNIYFSDGVNYRIRMISDHKPYFTQGHIQNIIVCTDSISTDTLLAVMDSNIAQGETWELVSGPTHGTATAAYTHISTGGIITPTGLSYTPATGYVGTDTFRVSVNDGIGMDTTTICVKVNPVINIGLITGADSVCPGNTIILSDTATGGVWSSTATGIVVVDSATGIVSGITPGMDTIVYAITVSGCRVSTIFPFKVLSYVFCKESTSLPTDVERSLSIFPDPNSGAFTLHISSVSDEAARVVITNMMGQRVKEFTTATNRNIDVQLAVPAGVYFISVATAEGVVSGKVAVGNNSLSVGRQG